MTPDPFEWAGRFRDYAVGTHHDPKDASWRQLDEAVGPLDAAVAARGKPRPKALYEKGRKHSAEILTDFDNKIGEATEEADIGTLKVRRKLLPNYADFP